MLKVVEISCRMNVLYEVFFFFFFGEKELVPRVQYPVDEIILMITHFMLFTFLLFSYSFLLLLGIFLRFFLKNIGFCLSIFFISSKISHPFSRFFSSIFEYDIRFQKKRIFFKRTFGSFFLEFPRYFIWLWKD